MSYEPYKRRYRSPSPDLLIRFTNGVNGLYDSYRPDESRFNIKRRSNPNGGDVQRWQFWPKQMAMGSLTGRQFTPMIRNSCVCEPDPERPHMGSSFLAFDFARKLLVMRAQFENDDMPPGLSPLNAELPFADISAHGIHHSHEQNEYGHTLTVTVSYRRAPRYTTRGESHPSYMDLPKSQRPYRRRATSFDFVSSSEPEGHGSIIKAFPDDASSRLTCCNAFRWILRVNDTDLQRFIACTTHLRAFPREEPLLCRSRQPYTVLDPPAAPWSLPTSLETYDFGTQAAIEGLVGNGILRAIDVDKVLMHLNLTAPMPAFRHRLLQDLFCEDRIRDPKIIVWARASALRRSTIPAIDHLVMIRTVRVTPTRLLIGPPHPESSNSVTRRYRDRLDAIIRVQFTDEGGRLHLNDKARLADVNYPEIGLMARVRRALQSGIQIAGHRYYPVASSSSQQKDHAIWFVDPTVIDNSELRNWMGRVDETIVAKHAARMGLPFSTSRAVNLDITIGQIDDVERDNHCFTDGCGIAGSAVMAAAAKALNQKGLNASPSVIQFRLGGAKGVLAWWPNLAEANEIRMRPSQVKFTSNLKELNVVRVAKYQVAFLNRQFIMIMEALGVPQGLFVQIFQKAIHTTKGLCDRVKAGCSTADDFQLMSGLCNFPLMKLINNGFNDDPLVWDVCHIVESRALSDIKWRGRVKLPGGVFLMGIADETGALGEGEVFCQYQKSEQDKPVVVEGLVLVCRAPALHPGDIRHALAVDLPHLHHLKNVIVFSTQGDRPLPDMLGGGDLDGDDFTLIWDTRFVNPVRERESMNYTAPPPRRVDKVVQSHLNENFVQYMLNDILGQVDNAHLALSDLQSPFSVDCLHLCHIHSTAVDFAKTGIAAVLNPELQPKDWPDFMGKEKYRSYQSDAILGQLFRMIHDEPTFTPSELSKLNYPAHPKIMALPRDPQLLDFLLKAKEAYENDMQYTMRRFKVLEVEVVAGLAAQTADRKRSRELRDLAEPLQNCFTTHVREVRLKAHEVAAAMPPRLKLEGYTPMQVIAWHAYAVTFDRTHVQAWETKVLNTAWGPYQDHIDRDALLVRPMISFAWVFADELVQIMQVEV